jgi:hypothetical protein
MINLNGLESLLSAQAELFAKVAQLQQLDQHLKQIEHPNKDYWLKATEALTDQYKRQIDLNMSKLNLGVYRDSQ